MKRSILMVSAMLLLAFSCTKNENNYYGEEVFDLKASKMEQIGSLFESISRQPEAAIDLIKATEGLYYDYNELLPISDQAVLQRGKARGSSFGLLLTSIARQPEAFHRLDSAAAKFLGAYSSVYISSELSEITKTYAMSALNDAIARQPECIGMYDSICRKYINFQIMDPEE